MFPLWVLTWSLTFPRPFAFQRAFMGPQIQSGDESPHSKAAAPQWETHRLSLRLEGGSANTWSAGTC
ncbi:MAG: hypothetical protein U1E05_19935, partial [Patescibacteria group bacterium]|nr:hypothetical protein [Patescibacteria group bacterium]